MEPRLSLVTLGVADVAKARRFYEALGFVASSASAPGVAFFKAGGVVLALYGRADLAADADILEAVPNSGGITLAHNTRSEGEVDRVLAEASSCGGTLVKPGAKTSWGGYCGYFSDPDGHLWEVAYNPSWPLDGAGAIKLP
jgi:catechol 2,3-dioxygenase-like lactoylglutathione lyase family enzyme